MLRSDLCDYSDAYIIVKGRITFEGDNDIKTSNKMLIFKNNATFRSCISKMNNTFIDNAEDLDIVMPMHKLLEYSNNYSIASESLQNYYRDEVNYDANENNAAGNKINNNKTIRSNFFEYKTKLLGCTLNDNNTLNAEVVISLKYLSNFRRFLHFPLINCEIDLDLSLSKEYIIFEISITPRVVGNPDVNPPVPGVAAIQTTGATFQINNAKIYVLVVFFSINDNINFLENIKQGFKRTISWNKYRSVVTTQAKNNNLDYLIDLTDRNINGLFVLSLKNGTDDPTRDFFLMCITCQ